MSTFERIDSQGVAHSLNQAEDKRARQKFRGLMDATARRQGWNTTDPDAEREIDEDPPHLITGQRRNDQTEITLIGHAADLHGRVCTCCPRKDPA